MNHGLDGMDEKSAKKTGGGKKVAGRRGTLSGKSRRGKSMMIKGGAMLVDTMAPGNDMIMAPSDDMTDGKPIHQVGGEGVRTGLSRSLI